MDNYISLLEKELNDKSLIIESITSPSYISCFLPEEEIILIHKTEAKKLVTKSTSEEDENNSMSAIDVTGHPLEMTLAVDNVTINLMDALDSYELLKKENERNHFPLKVIEARNCLDICNLKLNPPCPVWVVTDGNDPLKTVLISSYKSNGHITICWASDKGAVSNIPTLDSLKQLHACKVCLQNPVINYNVKSTYMIKTVLSEQNAQEFYSCTSLQACWDTFSFNPPMNRSTDVTLITTCKIGNGSGGLLFLWRQLLLIHEYVEIILNRSTNHRVDVNVKLPSCVSYLETINKIPANNRPITRIGKVLKEAVHGTGIIPDNSKSLTDIIQLFASSGRPGMDITDKLWFLFIECSTFEELSSCFKQLFIEIKKQTCTPFLNSSNISCLAGCLMGQGGANILNPLEYLVEIGLDKLKKDLQFIFAKAKIATLNSLNMPKLPKFSEVPASDWISVVQKWISWFSQIYCVLELLWNTQQAIYLNDSLFLTIASATLSTFTDSNSKVQSIKSLMENPLQEIKFNVPVLSVERDMPSIPIKWVLTLSTQLAERKVQSIFYRGIQSPFAHILPDLLNIDQTDDENITLNESNIYYWAEMYCITDEIF